jgi:hypothetical protein
MAQTVPPDDQLTTLYKESQGFANSNSAYEVEQETFVSRPNILSDRIFLNRVPDSAPTSLTQDITWGVTGSSAARYVSSMYWIVKYTGVPLTPFAGNPDETFYFGSAMNGPSIPAGTNLLANMLLPLMISTSSPTYRITVTDATGSTIIPPSNYILDRYAGIITIYPGNSVSSTDPPLISFWRYEGPTLRDTNIAADPSGNLTLSGNLTVTGLLTSPNFTAGNLTATTLNVNGVATMRGNTTINSLNVTNNILSNTMTTGILNATDHIDVGNGVSTITGDLDITLGLSSASVTTGDILGNSIDALGNITAVGIINGQSGITVSGGPLTTEQIISSGPINANDGVIIAPTSTLTTGPIIASSLITANNGLTVNPSGTLLSGQITASGLITANSSLTVAPTGILTTGAIAASGQISATGGINTGSSGLITGAIAASGLISANNSLAVAPTGTLTSGPIIASGLIEATNGLTVSGTLNTGAIQASSLISANNGLTVAGTLNTGAIIAGGPVTANAGATVSGTLNTGAIVAGGLVTANNGLTTGAVTSNGLITANNGVTITGTLTTGAIQASSLISANNGLTVGGTLNTGAIQASSLISANNGLTVGGTLNTGAVASSGLIAANNGLTVTGTLNTGAIVAGDTITANAGINVAGGTLSVTNLTVNSSLVAPNIGNGGNTTINGTLVTNTITNSGIINVNNTMLAGQGIRVQGNALTTSDGKRWSLYVNGSNTQGFLLESLTYMKLVGDLEVTGRIYYGSLQQGYRP